MECPAMPVAKRAGEAPNSTLVHGLRILQALAGTAVPCGVSELARQLGLPKSQVHRLLQTLVGTGFVRRTVDLRRYCIGLKPLELSSALLQHHALRRLAMPILHRLSAETGEDAILSVLHDDCALIIAAIYPEGRQRDPAASVGNRMALHAAATGKLLLAFAPDVDAIVARLDLVARTPRTITSRPALRRELARIRAAGIAVNDSENATDLVSFGVPVRGVDGAVLAGFGQSMRLPESQPHLERNRAAVVRLGAELSAAVQAAGLGIE